MANITLTRQEKGEIKNVDLILFAYATVFFPRFFTFFGAPDPLNFAHLLIVPVVSIIAIFSTRTKNREQIKIVLTILAGLAIFLICLVTSSLVNGAGLINAVIQLLLFGEPYLLLIAMMAIPISKERLVKLRNWLLGFALFNLFLALAQSVLLPIGIYPHKGGTIQDATAGVFTSGPGSAGNYVSCTVSIYFSVYALLFLQKAPLWMRVIALFAALYQTEVSDSKQIFLAMLLGCVILFLSRLKNPLLLLGYVVAAILGFYGIVWILQNIQVEALSDYANWVTRPGLYGPDGAATQTKLASFFIIPKYFESSLGWIFGLGPGHSVTRLGGWMMPKYEPLLRPLGATSHPVSEEVFRVVSEGWIAQESTIFFPLFTWAGIWGDFGIAGLMAYLYLGYILMTKVCVDNLGRFMIWSTFILGFILTQMEEPGHTLTIAILLGIRWHEERLKKQAVVYSAPSNKV